jgi:hypothetical protein
LRRCTDIVLKVKVEAKVKIEGRGDLKIENRKSKIENKPLNALLLLAFGGPRSLEEVEFLLTRLFRGRKPSPEQLEMV